MVSHHWTSTRRAYINSVQFFGKMEKRYYLDTSIWLDFFENRNEPKIPKGDWARQLLEKMVKNDGEILYSDIVLIELKGLGYEIEEFKGKIEYLGLSCSYVESTVGERKKAKDLSAKRKVPRGDALHALIARDHHAILITLDHHFKSLADITSAKRPQEVIFD